MRRALLLLVAALALLVPATSGVAAPKADFNTLELQFMCVTCGVPLNIADSPQADEERRILQELVDQGFTEDQIKARFVEEYGSEVLADPPGDGFGIAAWLVPVGLLVLLLAAAAVVLPRWRRRGGAGRRDGEDDPSPLTDELDPEDARRLDEDLARYAL